jgi:vacuolar-type H+-ATPase subunit H
MKRNAAKSSEPAPEPGPKDRQLGLAMLAEGWHLNDVAATLKINRNTVRRWRDCPEGQRMLSEAKAKRAEIVSSALGDAREILSTHAVQAARTLVDKLRDPKPFEALTAAEGILSRVGLPKASKVEMDMRAQVDLSRLAPEELDAFERLLRKAMGA